MLAPGSIPHQGRLPLPEVPGTRQALIGQLLVEKLRIGFKILFLNGISQHHRTLHFLMGEAQEYVELSAWKYLFLTSYMLKHSQKNYSLHVCTQLPFTEL